MKTLPLLAASLFVFAAPAIAQDGGNPFVKNMASDQPLPSPGPAFASVLEHFLVPPDLLDDWLRDHPLKDDATELRAAVQDWVVAGKAEPDHTVLTFGTGGRESTSGSIMEKIYPTEFAPGGADAWPWPTAFTTRNLGMNLDSGIAGIDESPSLWVDTELLETKSSNSYQPLIEQTRKPGDIFLLRVRKMKITQIDQNTSQTSIDPFAPPSPRSSDFTKPRGAVFAPGAYRLASRFDPLSDEKAGGKWTRLVFYRGEIAPSSEKLPIAQPEASQISFRTVRVSLPAFSSWLMKRSPLAIGNDAWAAVEGWDKEGTAETIGTLSTAVRESMVSGAENIDEYIYPTEVEPNTDRELIEEWKEGKSKNGKDGIATMSRYKITPRPGLDGAGLATAFDTRNIGNTAESTISRDDRGIIVRCDWGLVRLLGQSVYHRIKVGDEWIPDVEMPLFVSNSLRSTIRIRLGEWELLGTVSEYLETETIDSGHCLLVFVKVE